MENAFLFVRMDTLLTQQIRFVKNVNHRANIVQERQQIAQAVILCL